MDTKDVKTVLLGQCISKIKGKICLPSTLSLTNSPKDFYHIDRKLGSRETEGSGVKVSSDQRLFLTERERLRRRSTPQTEEEYRLISRLDQNPVTSQQDTQLVISMCRILL